MYNLDNIPAIPLAPWVESAMDWLTNNFSVFFDSIQKKMESYS